MKIKSRFKDYYDFYSLQYADPKHIWERKLFMHDDFPFFEENMTKDEVDLQGLSYYYSKGDYEFRWLIVCGKRFLLFRKLRSAYRDISKYDPTWTAYKESKEVEDNLNITRTQRSKYNYFSRHFPEYFMGDFSEKNLNFCIKHKSPIVLVSVGLNYFTTDSPILGDIVNFVSMYSTEQIYQDISYFMMNQINGSPDIDPPVDIDNEGKILSHGFDLKQSFRHRK